MRIELTLLPRVAFQGREVTSARLRGLLALLATDLREGCGSARLVDELWPDEQPENPTKALQVVVSRARARLGAELIASTPTGYRLTLADEQVDAALLVRYASASAQHARAGDHEAALDRAEAGLALWDGKIDQHAHGDPLAALRINRVGAQRGLVRTRALALSRLGRAAEALESLAELVRERPRDEELRYELLRCQAATAGNAEAIASYESYRRELRDDLGADPGSALRGLHAELLRAQAPAVRHGVAHEPNPLLGRADDMAAVRKLIRTSRVTSIIGPGGLGKTRLANVVSREAEQRVVHFVSLAGVRADVDVLGEVASALGVLEANRPGLPPAHTEALTAIVGVLGSGPALLVLDNCEHVVGGTAELVRALVAMTAELRVLTTSRTPLELSSESVYSLPELDLSTTVTLFEQRARAVRPDVELPVDIVTELCGHLDGLPLAVELAAARVRVFSVAEIARRLDDRFAILRGSLADAPERHQTLLSVVEWSWQLLTPAEQAAMRTLSVFPGGCTVATVERLIGAEALPLLESLTRQSLLKLTEAPAGSRFRMLETVREFSVARRDEAGETPRVVEDFLSWARNFGLERPHFALSAEHFAVANEVRDEQDNLVLALRYGLDRADADTVVAIASVLVTLWVTESNPARMATLAAETEYLLSHYRPAPEFVESLRTVAAMFGCYVPIQNGSLASRWLVVLRRLPPATPDTPIQALAVVLAVIAARLRETVPAIVELASSAEPLLAGLANLLASFLLELDGDLVGTREAAANALTALHRVTPSWMLALAEARVGDLYSQNGQGELAIAHLRVAADLQEQLGDHKDVTGVAWGMVVAYLAMRDADHAERWLTRACGQQVDPGNEIYPLEHGLRAEIALIRGEVDVGLRGWRGVLPRIRRDDRLDMSAVSPDPLRVEVLAAGVVAHAWHGRLDLVPVALEELRDALPKALETSANTPIDALTVLPMQGVLLAAVGIIDVLDETDERRRASGARMVALAERFRHQQTFQTTLPAWRIRQAALAANRPAYEDAVATYAGLDSAELASAARALLANRPAELA